MRVTTNLVFTRGYSCKWTGSNGAEIATLLNDNSIDGSVWTVESESSTLRLRQTSGLLYGIETITASRPWIISMRNYQGIYARLADSDYQNQLLEMAGFASEPDMPHANPPTLTVATAAAALPAMLINATATITCTFDVTMPNTAYNLKWRAIAGATVLSQITQNGAVTKTTTGCTIPIKAGLASVAGVLLAEAYALT